MWNTRYRHGKFSLAIKARPIEGELFHFWNAGRSGDPARRFLYNYQILEYAAHYVLDEGVKTRIRKALKAPNATDDLDGCIEIIVDAVNSSKIHDSQKVSELLSRVVDHRLLWREIQRNKEFFNQATVFEGGFEIKALGHNADEFARN